MQRGDLSFQQIYNRLMAGAKLAMQFSSASEAETFRTRMHHHKTKQDRVLEGLGVANEEERTVLSFKVQRNQDDPADQTVVAFVTFANRSPLRKYPVIILEASDIKPPQVPANAEVSENLGTA